MNIAEIIAKARHLQRSFKSKGSRTAAGFLRNQGVELNAALRVLGFPVRYPELSEAKQR